MRRRAACALLLLPLLGACGSGETRTTSESSSPSLDATAGGPAVALQGLGLSDPLAATIVADEQRVMVVDGLSTANGQAPTTSAWVAPKSDVQSATVLDLSSIGPRVAVAAAWWNDQVAIVGRQCPAILNFEGAEPQAELEQVCGSNDADVFAVDPTTGEVRHVVGPIEIGSDEHLRILAVSDDEVLLQHGANAEVVNQAGERRPVSAPPEDAAEAFEPGFVCELGGQFHAVSMGPGGPQDPPLPIATHISLSVLEGESWQPVAVPPSEVETQQVFPLGCSVEGMTLASVDTESEGLDLLSSTTRVHAIDRASAGELALRTLPTDGLSGVDDALHPRLIGDQIIASHLTAVERDASESETFLWTDPSWTRLEGRTDMFAYTYTPSVFEAVLVETSKVLRMADGAGDLLQSPFDGVNTSLIVE